MSDVDLDEDGRPEHLPPVEPPSAGFIVQLFLVPAVIVGMIIIGYWMLQRMVRPDQDWQALVADLQSPHDHLRWHGAFGLAQMLQADSESFQNDQENAGSPSPSAVRPTEVRLVQNRVVADKLCELLTSELKKNSTDDDDLKVQAFLARTLGLFQLPDAVLPTLRIAMQPDHDTEVRKNALGAIALIAGRELESGRMIDDPKLVEQVILVSQEELVLIRQMAAFDLGLLPGDSVENRLEVLLADPVASVRANAAVGLARKKSQAGLPVFKTILKSAWETVEPGSPVEYEQFLSLKNSLTAVTLLDPDLAESDRSEFIELLEPIAARYREPRIRLDAEKLLLALRE